MRRSESRCTPTTICAVFARAWSGETQQDREATESVLAHVDGTAVQTWAAGAVECAAGPLARALSTAEAPEGVPVGPSTLADTGRALAWHGDPDLAALTIGSPRGLRT